MAGNLMRVSEYFNLLPPQKEQLFYARLTYGREFMLSETTLLLKPSWIGSVLTAHG